MNINGALTCPLTAGTINSILPEFIVVWKSVEQVNLVFRDEFSSAPRFRISIEGSGAGSAAFSQQYNISSYPELSTLTNGDKIKVEMIITETNMVCSINSIILDVIPFAPTIQNLIYTTGIGPGPTNPPPWALFLFVEHFITH